MIRAIIVDDEPLSLQLLEKKLSSIGEIEVVACFYNAETALAQLKELDFQAVFLDIEMAGLSGLDLAEIISEWNPGIHIVFVTAYRDYAVQAFELNSIDYLLKPVMEERLEKTISRIKEQIQLEQHLPARKHTPSLKIQYFKEFAVYDQEELIKWKTNKAKELFAYLFMHQHTYIHRDTLINILWPEQDYKKAKIQLHTNISYLRKTCAAIGIEKALHFTNESYRLQMKEYICDAESFENFTNNGLTNENIKEAEQVIALYAGDYTEKNAYVWALSKSKLLKEKLLSLLQQLIDFFTETKDNQKKQFYLQLLLTHDPYCEPAIRQLIQHHLQSGNRMEAIILYKDFALLLEEELGIQPEPATSSLLKIVFPDSNI
ncbi:MAG: response regulator [Bacillus sp. (in: firmicutes)]